ncbi:MAG: DNA polymerase III subunit alpha [Bacteroidales bacterium]|nr:MAG: DNA polymerase III subunit alpha [Bacteroidales bacterium]
MRDFAHLHVHSQYSILDGASSIPGLIHKAKENGMSAVAITDHGNMFGVKEFYNIARRNGIKPIIGCEIYVAKKSRFDRTEKEDRSGDHLILLAKNKTGYHNLVKLVSYAWIEGYYYKPRIDKELLRKYHDGLIVTSACIGGEIPQTILLEGKDMAKSLILEYKELFGEDFYLELQRHKTGIPEMDREVYERQEVVNRHLLELSGELDIQVIASNDVHFINDEDAEAHDRLICINTGKDLDDPARLRYTKQEFFKTREEMDQLFADVPEALENTIKVAEKVENYKLNQDLIMPDFPLPDGFTDEDEYLRHLTYEGAKVRYGEVSGNLKERIEFELSVIRKMGYPGYFLIVQDFLNAAREKGVSIGPGRGSAAGSVVAYCTQITDIDPIEYNLLFERFLNPERISMPDIDIDFDEDGRDEVLKWVVKKYGMNRVAHIITFGTMAAKMAIRDVARVQKLPLPEADRLAKLVPERPGVTLSQAYREVRDLYDARKAGSSLVSDTLKYAETLEGSVRHTGIHACGVIIGRDDLVEHVPLCTSKDSDLLVTQFDGNHVEDIGMLKMDFLGLKTLSIIKDAISNIKDSREIQIDINTIPLDDTKTYELYSRGETTGLFQFESHGMKKYLRELKPNRFEDLIAMNALYRPGPMEYIPSFINRKHGKEKIHYDLPIMKEFLQDTYGITVYQEQVMQLSQAMAGFSGGEADSLRKAMGKKQKKVMDEMKEKFILGSTGKGYDLNIIEKIWQDWEAFAQYAFNKSHSTCYAFVSYQTAYLKAHFPAEFMAAVLSRNINDIKKITLFMDETKRMGISVLGPDVNESNIKFTVNADGDIRFGLGAIKGVGESAAQHIIEERKENGNYQNIYDFVERINLSTINKKSIEALVKAGAFDGFRETKRGQYFATNGKGSSFIETIIRYGNKFQFEKSTSQQSLFGDSVEVEFSKPEIPEVQDWPKMEKLNKEKETIGIFLSAHPLDDFKMEIHNFCNASLSDFQNMEELNGKELTVVGIVTEVKTGTTKNGRPYGTMYIQDYSDSLRLALFNADFINFSKYFAVGYSLIVKGKVLPNQFRDNQLEFRISQINLLSEVRDNLINTISIKLPLTCITPDFIEHFDKISGSGKGRVKLKFIVYDPKEKIGIELYSRSKKVKLTDKFIRYLEDHQDIEFTVN